MEIGEEMNYSVSPRKFIKIWQKSHSVQEVATILGRSRQSVYIRGRMFKKNGVPLKRFNYGTSLNWKVLSAYAEKIVNKK